MGGKQWTNRKHLLFYGACLLIVLSISEGCIIPARRVQVLPEGGTPVEKASVMANMGKYHDALEAYSRIARSYPRDSPGDRALLEMGLIWVYPNNPKKDHVEALKYFQRLLRDFPKSPLREEAGAWVEVLNKITRRDRRIKDLEDKILSGTEQIIACKENCKEELRSYKEEIKSYEQEIDSCKEQINALKAIDIGIEKKKREELPEE